MYLQVCCSDAVNNLWGRGVVGLCRCIRADVCICVVMVLWICWIVDMCHCAFVELCSC